LAPITPGARALEKRLGQEEHQLEVAAILEPILSAARRVQRLTQVHEIQLSREKTASIAWGLLLRPQRRAVGGQIGDGKKGVRTPIALLQARSGMHREGRARAAGDHQRVVAAVWASMKPPSGSWRRTQASRAQARIVVVQVADAYDEKLEKADKDHRTITFRRGARIAAG